MKRTLRIVFMGTPEFAVSTLKTLIENQYTIVGVITAPDKPAGRGQKLSESAVKQYAKGNKLNILQPTNLKSDVFINKLKALKANLQIVVAFRMLPKVVWQMPEYGTFNLHASLLPNYRGAAPINWAIINGETTTGVSTFFIDDHIDTGELILQEEVSIQPNETVGELHDKLMTIGSELVLKTVVLISENKAITRAQTVTAKQKTAYKLNKDNCKIDWNKSLDDIYNKVRGLNPYPAAWTLLKNGEQQLNVKIYATQKIEESHQFPVGKIITSKNTMKVAVTQGFIVLKEIKLPGKRKMDISALLNGMTFHENSEML